MCFSSWQSGAVESKPISRSPSLPSRSCSISHERSAGQLLLGSDHGLKTNGPMQFKSKIKGVFSPFAQRWSCRGSQEAPVCSSQLVLTLPSSSAPRATASLWAKPTQLRRHSNLSLLHRSGGSESHFQSEQFERGHKFTVPGGYDHHPHILLPCDSWCCEGSLPVCELL